MKNHRKADQIATERAEMLGPLLTPGLDPAKRSQIIREICSRYEISERSIRRYLQANPEYQVQKRKQVRMRSHNALIAVVTSCSKKFLPQLYLVEMRKKRK